VAFERDAWGGGLEGEGDDDGEEQGAHVVGVRRRSGVQIRGTYGFGFRAWGGGRRGGVLAERKASRRRVAATWSMMSVRLRRSERLERWPRRA
jgi:hypothetical protein